MTNNVLNYTDVHGPSNLNFWGHYNTREYVVSISESFIFICLTH